MSERGRGMSEHYKYKRVYISIDEFDEEIEKATDGDWKIIYYQEKGCTVVVILEKVYFM